ncbi:MAG: glycosyltransferase [Archangium sp.]
MKSVVVVPCYNEENRVEPERFIELVEGGSDVLFVDDGSKDRTKEKLEVFIATQRKGFALHVMERNGGKAEAVRAGMRRAIDEGAEIVGYLDADLATPAGEMLRIVDAVRKGALVALGSRVSLLGRRIERKRIRHYLGRIFATSASLALGLGVYDTQCGAKAFATTDTLRSALNDRFDSRWAFDVELLSRLLKAPAGVPSLTADQLMEIPLNEWRDVKGSKLGPMSMAGAAADLLKVAAKRRLR